MTRSTDLTVNIDGAARGNPGPAAFAYVIRTEASIIARHAGKLGSTTNNLAEYTALVRALEHLVKLAPHRVLIRSDSELLVKQMNGLYKVKNENLRELYEEARELARQIPHLELRHVRRDENSEADQLCNDVLDGVWTEESQPDKEKDAAPAPAESVDVRAEAYLGGVALAWSKGKPFKPTPREVWEKLQRLLDS